MKKKQDPTKTDIWIIPSPKIYIGTDATDSWLLQSHESQMTFLCFTRNIQSCLQLGLCFNQIDVWSVFSVLLAGLFSVLFRQEKKQRKLKGSGLCWHSLSRSSDSCARVWSQKQWECESDALAIYLLLGREWCVSIHLALTNPSPHQMSFVQNAV